MPTRRSARMVSVAAVPVWSAMRLEAKGVLSCVGSTWSASLPEIPCNPVGGPARSEGPGQRS
jgi:hypothetical protein